MYIKGTVTCLLFTVLNVVDIGMCIALSLTLLLDKGLNIILSKIVDEYIIYSHIVYTIILTILGILLVGDFNNLVLKRAFDKKSFYTKIKIVACLLLLDLIIGICLISCFVINYLRTGEPCVIHASYALSIIAMINVLLYLCLYILHPDLWHTRRDREIEEMARELEAEQ